MYRNSNGQLTFSPTDLCTFLDSEFASWMDRWWAERATSTNKATAKAKAKDSVDVDPHGCGITCESDQQSAESKILSDLGGRHEAKLLRLFQDGKRSVVVIKERRDAGHSATLNALADGSDIIFQACLRQPLFEGYADFLVKLPGDSKLGNHHYEVWDTKLARSVKPHYAIQLCAYAEMLEQIQGVRPANVCVYLGRDHDAEQRLITSKFFYYYRHLRKSFERYHDHKTWNANQPPEPALSREFGRWETYANELLAKADHVSGVANIRRSQVKKLRDAEITTMSELAKLKKSSVPNLAVETLDRLRLQARLQVASRKTKLPMFEILPSDPDERRGLTLVPPPSPGDIFFDMEGYPLGEQGNLEYLFGVVFGDTKKRSGSDDPWRFQAWWAHKSSEEKHAFESFMDWVVERRKKHPDLHIYHYNSYETAALKRLMCQYATRENGVDNLLREHVFVDLYQVVRQSLAIGTPGYSLKDIEACYGEKHSGDVSTAAGSIVAYHTYLETRGIDDAKAATILEEIKLYNEQDCRSLAKLYTWLRERQSEAKLSYAPPPPPEQSEDDIAARPDEQASQQLLDGLAKLKSPERIRVQELLAHLCTFHRREKKPVWWRLFERNAMSDEELIDDFDCLGGLDRTKRPREQVKQSWAYEYRFDPEQDTKLRAGQRCVYAHDLTKSCTIENLDLAAGRVSIKLGIKAEAPPPHLNLIPNDDVRPKPLPEAISRFALSWMQGKVESNCVDDLLHRRPPKIRGHQRGQAIVAGGGDVTQIVSKVIELDSSTICIQGPPGTGKTYTAAEIIVALLKKGLRIGVTATAHDAIMNVLRAVHEACVRHKIKNAKLVKIGGEHGNDPLVKNGIIEHLSETKAIDTKFNEVGIVIGGTAWAFARDEVVNKFDFLIVDEAGQFSLANVVAVGQSARNLVLVGDPVQLPQVVQGTHPGESGKSCLEYLLGEHHTVPSELGIFLETSYRMHPDLCRFVSDAFYDSRLTSHSSTSKNTVACKKPNAKTNIVQKDNGIAYVDISHELNTQASEEEVEVIAKLVDQLVGGCYVARDGGQQKLTLSDIVIVAPYNLQVRHLQERLPGARVGTVDKFQGQEAPVAIVSLCASSGDECPRGLDFLLNRNRLNVAISRAKCLAIIVGCPDLMATRCSTLEQMELVNNLCWLADHAGWSFDGVK